jgi:hypothetical protein
VRSGPRIDALYRQSAPWPRLYEAFPLLVLASVVFWRTRSIASVAPVHAYLAYLVLDRFVVPQRRLTKWIRNASPAIVWTLWGPQAARILGLPEVPAGGALAALLAGALLLHLYERPKRAFAFIRGYVFACAAELLALHLAPTGVGPHVALPLLAAAQAWDRQTVLWQGVVPVMLAYAVAAPFLLAGGPGLVPHVVAGLSGWLAARLIPYPPATRPATVEDSVSLKL